MICACPHCAYARLEYWQREHKFHCPRCYNNFYSFGKENKEHMGGNFPLMAEGTLSSIDRWEKAPWEV